MECEGFGCDDLAVTQHHVVKIKGERLFNNRCAKINEHTSCVFEHSQHVFTELDGILAGWEHRNTRTRQRLGPLCWGVPLKQWAIAGSWIERICTGHQFCQDRGVAHIACHGADGVERTRQGQCAVQAD